MAAPDLVNLSGLMDDAKCFALWPAPLARGRDPAQVHCGLDRTPG